MSKHKNPFWPWIVALTIGLSVLPRPAVSDDLLQQLPSLQMTASQSLGGQPLTSISYSADGDYVACANSSSGKVWIVNAQTLAIVETLPIANIHVAQFAPHRRTLAIAGGRDLAIWDLDRRAVEFIPKEFDENVPRDSSFNVPRFTPDGARLVAAVGLNNVRNTLSVWDLSNRKLERQLVGQTDIILTIDISRDSRTLISGDISGNIILWDLDTGTVIQHLRKGDGTARAQKDGGFRSRFHTLDAVGFVGFIQDRVVARLCKADSTSIEFWRKDDGQTWKPDAPSIPSDIADRMQHGHLAISPDGQFLAGTTTEKLGVLLDLHMRKPVATFEVRPQVRGTRIDMSLSAIAFSPDGNALIAGDVTTARLCQFNLIPSR
jgi:WD40 repeat protein